MGNYDNDDGFEELVPVIPLREKMGNYDLYQTCNKCC